MSQDNSSKPEERKETTVTDEVAVADSLERARRKSIMPIQGEEEKGGFSTLP